MIKSIFNCLVILGVCSGQLIAQDYSWDNTAPACQILDKAPTPAFLLGLTYIADSDFDSYGSSRIAELDANVELGYYYDVLEGELDLAVDFKGSLFFSSAGLQMPDQLIALALDTGLTWRYPNGLALQVRVAPGIYSDLEELGFGSLSMPLSVAGIMSINPDVSVIAGVQYRLGFERELMPILGAVWSPEDWLRIEATLPEASLTYYIDNVWSANFRWVWESMTYVIREKGDYDREKITMESYRTSLGVTCAIDDDLKWTADIGFITEHGVEFDKTPLGMDDSIDLSDELFVRVGLMGPI